MESAEILTVITVVISWIFGIIAKKVSWFNNYLIPTQNIVIGVIFTAVEFFISKDINLAIAVSGLLAGGAYDVFNNGKKLLEQMKKDITNKVDTEK